MSARLNPVESIMWRAGQDPTRRLAVGALLLLDHAPKEAELIDRVALAIDWAPRLRWRPDDPTFTRIRPGWVEDEAPDPEHHVRTAEVAAPGSLRQVLDLLSLLEAVPFDLDRSPWDVTLIHGLEEGGAALYLRAHHVLTDGIGGVRMLQDLFDRPEVPATSRRAAKLPSDAEQPADAEDGGRGDAAFDDDGYDDDAGSGSRIPGTITIDLTRIARPLSHGIASARDARPLDVAIRGIQQALDLANSVSRQVMVTGGALSPTPPSHSMLSRFDVVSLPTAAKTAVALGGSRNDLLVVAAAAALGLYSERTGQRCPRVRLAMPARQRRDGDAGNWFAPTRVEIPTSTEHPGRQFSVVTERLAQARNEPALRFTSALASTISRLPNRMLLPALNTQADSVDLAVSTVPGLRGAPEICGAKVRAAYPLGPRLGVPLNLTAFGSHGGLDVGIALDAGSITDPDAYRECLLEAYRRLEPVALANA
jgi:WS/DGAT/MGAT family acyltransferase